jgi:hypothetical protein
MHRRIAGWQCECMLWRTSPVDFVVLGQVFVAAAMQAYQRAETLLPVLWYV